MHRWTHPRRSSPARRACRVALAALASGLAIGACGGSNGAPVATVASTTTATSSTTSAATASGPVSSTPTAAGATTPSALEADELAYAKCMRANGVPSFPDPSSGGGFRVPTGSATESSSPTFAAARRKCAKLLPGGGIPGPGAGPPPSAQTVAHWVKVAQCMRRHGVSSFPDPTTTAPSNLLAKGGGVISDRDGVILVLPHTLDTQSALFTRAAAACGFQLTNH